MPRYQQILGNFIPKLKLEGRNRFLGEKIFPLLYLLAVLLADHEIPATTVAPAFCSLGLMGMAFILSPGWMLSWGILYSLVIIGVFFNPVMYQYLNHVPLDEHSIPPSAFARSCAFCATALFCTLFSVTLSRFRKSHDEILGILSKFPKPIILSNALGQILYGNNAARRKFSLDKGLPKGTSIYDLLAPEGKKGFTISLYLQHLETNVSEGTIPLEYHGEAFEGETMILDSSEEKLIVTIMWDRQASLLNSSP